MGKFPTKFKGTGTSKNFIGQIVSLFKMMNDVEVKMPVGYTGEPITIEFDNRGDGTGQTKIDLHDALFFVPSNIVYDVTGGYTTIEARVDNGRLIIDVDF